MNCPLSARLPLVAAPGVPRVDGASRRLRQALIRAAACLAALALLGSPTFSASGKNEPGAEPRKERDRTLPHAVQPAGQPSGPSAKTGNHPLDPALAIAREGLERIRQNVRDYTATLIKRELINGRLSDYQYSFVKIRHRRIENGQVVVPFSVYLKFLKPRSVAGREVIWVEGRNGGKLLAHEGGLKNLLRFQLDPHGFVAMLGNRYPITEIGFLNLIEQLLHRGERERLHGECEVLFHNDARVDSRPCTMIEVVHPHRRPHFDFHMARIFIDQELNIPVQYAAWSWPERPGGPPVLLEEYTYRDVRLNVGLTDRDFDPDHPEYRFP